MSEKLRKYLAYYQKVLNSEPENIEARLRLAAIFREMGKDSHAVSEYVTASKLLAKEGLPLEAIAACKAVLELEPGHTEVQYFLARLFAQVPAASGESVRVARPLDPLAARRTPSRPVLAAEPTPVPQPESTPPPGVPITLDRPKPGEATRRATVPDDVWDDPTEEPTRAGDVEGLANEETSPLDRPDDDDTSPLRDGEEDESLVTTEREHDPAVFAATTRPIRPLDPGRFPLRTDGDAETFEVNVFDMDSLALEEQSDVDLQFLDGIDSDVSDLSSGEISDAVPAVFEVSREDLPRIPLLSELPANAFARLLPLMDLQRVTAGTAVLRPGHTSRTLYIIVKGATLVTRDVDGEEVTLARMGEGDFFGEFVLLTGRSGAATVRAETACEILAIHENVVEELGDEYPEIWDALWDFYYARMLNNLLASSDIFRPLDATEREELAARFELHEVVANEVFIAEGEPCRHLHLIVNGQVDVQRTVGGESRTLTTLREGEFFGIASSLNDEPYLADVRAARDTVILRLPSEDFRAVADSNAEVDAAVQLAIMSRRELNEAFVSGITAYAELGVARADGA